MADAAGNTATATRTVTVTGARSVDLNASVAMDMLWVQPDLHDGQRKPNTTTLTKGFYLGKYEVRIRGVMTSERVLAERNGIVPRKTMMPRSS